MFSTFKISSLAVLTALLFASSYASAKNKSKHKKQTQKITIGFQTGRDSYFNTTPKLSKASNSTTYGANQSLFLKKTIAKHFKAETHFDYYLTNNNPADNKLIGTPFNNLKPFKISVPVSVQYYILPENCTIKPYCGLGLQYTQNVCPKAQPISQTDIYRGTYPQMPGTKYVSILFTQGVTFQVSTKIEITQSIHFVPNSTDKTFGIDLGIGYKLP